MALADRFLPGGAQKLYIATGMDFPDAIAGAVLAAKRNSGVVLVRGDRSAPNQVVQNFFNSRSFKQVYIFGGEPVVSRGIEYWFRDNL